MNCCFIDKRVEFFGVLAAKLGQRISFAPACPDDRQSLLNCDVVIVGIPTPHDPAFESQLACMDHVVQNESAPPVVAFIPSPSRELVMLAMAHGAYDCFVETSSMNELRITLERAAKFHDLNRELQKLRSVALPPGSFESVLTCDPVMREVCALATKVANTDTTLLLTGPTGTGKELLARAIHQASSRSAQPFVAVACSSLPESLIEAELFGHEKGAFTGAAGLRRGRFEAAGRGTILLDEVGELTPSLQVKLLRVLQERVFERLGSNESRPLQARLICATNRQLKEMVKANEFRADFYYRISTVEITLPPLSQRKGDILLLAHAFMHAAAERHGRPVRQISPAAMTALQEHDWPGNIRELQNVIERAVVVSGTPVLSMGDLPPEFAGWTAENDVWSFEDEVRSFKRRLIERTLQQTGYNKMQAARELRMPRSSLHRAIEELHIPSGPGPSEDERARAPGLTTDDLLRRRLKLPESA